VATTRLVTRIQAVAHFLFDRSRSLALYLARMEYMDRALGPRYVAEFSRIRSRAAPAAPLARRQRRAPPPKARAAHAGPHARAARSSGPLGFRPGAACNRLPRLPIVHLAATRHPLAQILAPAGRRGLGPAARHLTQSHSHTHAARPGEQAVTEATKHAGDLHVPGRACRLGVAGRRPARQLAAGRSFLSGDATATWQGHPMRWLRQSPWRNAEYTGLAARPV
jgi:hypothetical protein